VVLAGGLVLLEVTSCVREYRNVSLFHLASTSEYVNGRIEYSKSMMRSLVAYDLNAFSGIYLLFALFFGSWLCFGGAVTCFMAGRRQRDWAMIS
jgi:hypothetical protein